MCIHISTHEKHPRKAAVFKEIAPTTSSSTEVHLALLHVEIAIYFSISRDGSKLGHSNCYSGAEIPGK
jgi:hypothetical protein